MSWKYRSLSSFLVAGALVTGWLPVASASQLLVSNIFNDTIDLYNLTASSATLSQAGFISSGSLVLDEPTNVVVGPDGRIYVCSRGTGEVLVYSKTGQPAPGPGGLGVYANLGAGAAPAFMAFGPDGKLYVTDQGGDSVKIFDGISAAPIGSIVGPGVGNADPNDDITLVQPSGLDFGADGKLYISTFDAFGASQLFVWDGTNTTRILDPGAAAATFVFAAAGLETGGGNMYVASLGGIGIVSYTTGGAPVPPFYVPIPFVVPPTASFFPTNAPSDLIFDGSDLLISVLGSTNPGETTGLGGAGYPRGGLLRYTADGQTIVLAENIFPASSLALLETESVPEPTSVALGLAGALMLGCCWYMKCRHHK